MRGLSAYGVLINNLRKHEVKNAHSRLDITTRVVKILEYASLLNMLDETRDLARNMQRILFIPQKRGKLDVHK